MKRRRLKILPVAILTLFTAFLVVIAVIIIVTNSEVPLPMEYGDIIEDVAYREGIAEHILYAVIFTPSTAYNTQCYPMQDFIFSGKYSVGAYVLKDGIVI